MVPSSFLLPSSLAASSLGVLCPLLPFGSSWSSCRGSCFHFILVVTPSGVPWRSSVWFLVFLSSLLALVASFSYLGFLSSSFQVLSSLGCTSTRVFLHLVPSRFTFLVGGWSSSMALLLPGRLHPSLPLAITGAFSLSLLAVPSSCGVTVLCTVRSFGCGVVLLVSMTCCSLGFLALSSVGYLGASFPVLPAVSLPFCFLPGVHVFFVHGFRLPLCFSLSFFLARLRASALRFPFCISSSCGLHPDVSASAFPGYCLFRSSVLLFLSLCIGAWSACLVFMLCVCFLGLPSSLFPSVRHFLSFFRRSSDSIKSPLHYATGSPFGPSQLLV